MLDKFIKFIYKLDIIGPSPRLYLFNQERYKNIFSLIISIIIILIAFAFIVYSLVTYIKNERPSVVYSKSNDIEEERKIYLKDMLLMFQIMDNQMRKLNESIAYLESTYTAIYDNAKVDYSLLKVNKCKPGENMKSEYENFLKEKINELTRQEIQQDKNIEDFYCISSENSAVSLFHNPNEGYSFIELDIILKNQSIYKPESLTLMILYENNLINHDNKESPITEGISYNFVQDFSSDDFYTTNINFQYLKYETDDGLFFDSMKYFKGMSFLDMSYHKNHLVNYNLQDDFNNYNSSKIGTVSFELNKSNYDLYRRTYKKIQALLAEIMSILSLLFEIGGQIVAFVNEKKMNVDIIRQLFNPKNKKNYVKKIKFSNNISVKNNSDLLNNSPRSSDKNICKETQNNIDEDYEIKALKILKKINIFNILKSFICNGHKDKLISLCNEIIIEDMGVETILERFYTLGNICKLINDEEKNNISFDKEIRFKSINSLINDITNQIPKSGTKRKKNHKK